MPETTTAQLIIVDSSPFFCDGMRTCLGAGGHVVLSHAHTIEDTLQLIDTLPLDSVILGPSLSEDESLAICREIACRCSSIKTVIFTSYAEDPLFRADAIYAGAAACLCPDITHKECLATVVAVMTGRSLFSREELVNGLQPIRLAGRERDVLKLLANGKSDSEIAKSLALQVRTVRNYVQRTLEKLSVHNRQEAVRRARRRGWPV